MAFSTGTISNICKQMETEGASEGGFNRPDSNAVAPDLNEVKAITTAKEWIASEETSFADALVAAERQSRDISQRIDALEASCASHAGYDLVETAFRSSLAKNDHDLVSACASEMEARAALNGFKSRNSIKDPARYPDDKLFHFSLLILFVAIETGVNAFFYEGSTGLLGGAMVALAVSLVNMGIASVLGALFRYSNLPDQKYKLVGYGSLAVFILTGFVLNLIFSTFRIQYELVQLRVVNEGLSEPTTVMLIGALKTAVVDAFSVFYLNFPSIDFMSFTMFFVGFGCSVIAFWKGYTFDDKHPGYGDMDRNHKTAEKKFREIKDRTFIEAEAEVRKMASDIEQLRDQIIGEQHNISALKAQAQGVHSTFISATKNIQTELNLVIEAYRAANRATRATSAPVYFSTLPDILPADDGSIRRDALLKEIDAVAAMAKNLANSRATELGDQIIQIKQKINELIELAFNKQIDAVHKRAELAIASRGQLGN